jgi:hypothetical protein
MPDDDRLTFERFVTQIDDDMFALHHAANNGNAVFMEVMSASRIAIRSRDGISIPIRAAFSRTASKSGSIPAAACTMKRPRNFVCQLLFSTSLWPLTISHAQGCRMVRTLMIVFICPSTLGCRSAAVNGGFVLDFSP